MVRYGSFGITNRVVERTQLVNRVQGLSTRNSKHIATRRNSISPYARGSFGYIVCAQTIGRMCLDWTRLCIGRESFNNFVGLPPEHRGWLPDWILINNSTNGLGNPLSKLYTAYQLQGIFSAFRDIRLEKHYLPRRKIPVIGPVLPRFISYRLGRRMANYWYIKAVK